MPGMWHDLFGTWGYLSGNAPGTATVPAGACVLQIIAHASAASTLTIFGGSNIVIPALGDPMVIRFNHLLVQANSASQAIVFGTNVDSWYVEFVKAGNV